MKKKSMVCLLLCLCLCIGLFSGCTGGQGETAVTTTTTEPTTEATLPQETEAEVTETTEPTYAPTESLNTSTTKKKTTKMTTVTTTKKSTTKKKTTVTTTKKPTKKKTTVTTTKKTTVTTKKTVHQHKYTEKKVAATCTETGYSTFTCSCGDSYVGNSVAELGHNYVSGACSRCGEQDADYVPEFTAGTTWTVPGQWEFTFESAYVTVVKNGKQTVEVTWKYKNIGYSGELDIGQFDFTVYDGEMEKADWTVYDVDCVDSNGAGCINGTKATCRMGWVLNNQSSSMKIYVEQEDSNDVVRKALFTVPVTDKPEDPADDPLQGCTITLDEVLPQTISYYTSGDVLQSSCLVTEVRFEVDGDDLTLYMTGEKTYDSRGEGQSDRCKIGWKLYDANNYVVADGTLSTLSIAIGEGFLDAVDTAYDCIKPGESYRVVLLNVN